MHGPSGLKCCKGEVEPACQYYIERYHLGGKSREVRGCDLTIFGGAETLLPSKVILPITVSLSVVSSAVDDR